MSGGLTLRNLSNIDEPLASSVRVKPGDRIQLHLYLHNRDPTMDIRDVRVQFRAVEDAGVGIPFEARVCTPDAPMLLLSSSAQSGVGQVRVEFLTDTASVRAMVEGEHRTRDTSDGVFASADGALVGPVKANLESDLATISVAVELQVLDKMS